MPSSRRSRRRPYGDDHPELDLSRVSGSRRTEIRRGEEWVVQPISGGAKDYTCPGCGGLIAAGTPHIAAWPSETVLGAADGLASRRHWHTGCWQRFA